MNFSKTLLAATLLLGVLGLNAIANPVLTPGVWKNISPPGITDFGCTTVEIDPSNPSILYTAIGAFKGGWKSTDGGSTWNQLGNPNSSYNYETHTAFLDGPSNFRVDPKNSNHLYATQGVRGKTYGFWESTDGGNNWVIPAGFASMAPTRDVVTIDVDPTDFRHVLIGSHSPWQYAPAPYTSQSSGFVETKDGGQTCTLHMPPSGWPWQTNKGIQFLYDPDKKFGDNTMRTWLVETDGFGFWRTTDAGSNWTQVSNTSGAHATPQAYYASTGALYCASGTGIMRSTNNGATWSALNGIPYGTYGGLQGDGNVMYTSNACACEVANYNELYITSPETDGQTWTPYQGGGQRFNNGPNLLKFDRVNRIMYAAQWADGIWALKVPGSTRIMTPIPVSPKMSKDLQKDVSVFDLSGRMVARAGTYSSMAGKPGSVYICKTNNGAIRSLLVQCSAE
jgi:photosystem II stability/assembly factor-like uncharacterized protein